MWYMLSMGYLSPFFTAIGHLLILNNQSSVESIVHVGDIMLMEWLCWFSGLVQQRVWLTYKISGLPFGMLVLCHVCDILKVYIERGRLAFVSSGIPSDIVLQTLISFFYPSIIIYFVRVNTSWNYSSFCKYCTVS